MFIVVVYYRLRIMVVIPNNRYLNRHLFQVVRVLVRDEFNEVV